MSIKVRFFASLKEQLGRQEQCLDTQEIKTVKDVWKRINPEESLPEQILTSVNMDYADENTPVKDGDEVAFFPRVTGG